MSSTFLQRGKAIKIFGSILLIAIVVTAFGIGLKVKVQSAQAQSHVPTVDVIRDVTGSSGCTLSYHSKEKNLSLPCPAGTMLTVVEIPLTTAKATHENFVPALPRNATTAQLAAHDQQIETLKGSVSRSFTSTNPLQKVRPLTNCGGIGYWSENFNNWHGLTGTAEVYVSRNNSGCNLYETDSVVNITTASQSWWWGSDQYSNQRWGHSCWFMGDGYHEFGGSHYINAGGYTWEQNFSNNSGCSGRSFWTDIGPLS